MKTIDKIITDVDCSRGAPMGRSNVIPDYRYAIIDMGSPHKFLVDDTTRKSKRIFDSLVPMSSDYAYDKGGAYWGTGAPLRVRYTKDLTYIEFYRQDTRF